jgi:hypothetical protein
VALLGCVGKLTKVEEVLTGGQREKGDQMRHVFVESSLDLQLFTLEGCGASDESRATRHLSLGTAISEPKMEESFF